MLDALIVEVSNEDTAAIGNRSPARRVELTGTCTGPADGALRIAVKVEDLNAVIKVFRDLEFVIMDCEIHGAAKFARRLAGRAELALETAVGVEDLDASIA